MNSGTIVQSRAQVLIGSRLPDVAVRPSRAAARRRTGLFSANVPCAISERFCEASLTSYLGAYCGPGSAAADDRRVRRLAAAARLAALGQHAGRASRDGGRRRSGLRRRPSGGLTGFIATPRTCGRRPSQRLRPALPRRMFMWSALPTAPMVARQAAGMRRTSPEGRVICAQSLRGPSTWRRRPAERQSWPPPPAASRGCGSSGRSGSAAAAGSCRPSARRRRRWRSCHPGLQPLGGDDVRASRRRGTGPGRSGPSGSGRTR